MKQRSRVLYFILTLLVIGLGLASRRITAWLPDWLNGYPGDALWAIMVFCGLGFLFPRLATARLALTALAISFTVEISQLYHAAWIDAVRKTVPGALVLGSHFAWFDLIAYTVGVSIGALAEMIFLCWSNRNAPVAQA